MASPSMALPLTDFAALATPIDNLKNTARGGRRVRREKRGLRFDTRGLITVFDRAIFNLPRTVSIGFENCLE